MIQTARSLSPLALALPESVRAEMVSPLRAYVDALQRYMSERKHLTHYQALALRQCFIVDALELLQHVDLAAGEQLESLLFPVESKAAALADAPEATAAALPTNGAH